MIIHTFDANGRELTAEELTSMELSTPELENIFGEVLGRIMDAEEEFREGGVG